MKKSFLSTFLLFLAVILCARQTQPQSQPWEKHHIPQPSDGKAFDYQLQLKDNAQTHQAFTLLFPSPVTTDIRANNTVSGELFIPRNMLGPKRHPAVQVFHVIGPGNFDIERTICRKLAAAGFVCAFIHLPYFDRRGGLLGPLAIIRSPECFFNGLDQAMKDARRANDVLLSISEVDPGRLGACGASLGGLMSANAVAADPRISRAMLIIAGGDLKKILATNVRETEDMLRFISSKPEAEQKFIYEKLNAYDPMTLTPALRKLSAKHKLMMVNASADNVFPPACSQALADRVACPIKWYPGDHYSIGKHFQDLLNDLLNFFAPDRPLNWKVPVNTP